MAGKMTLRVERTKKWMSRSGFYLELRTKSHSDNILADLAFGSSNVSRGSFKLSLSSERSISRCQNSKYIDKSEPLF